MKSKEFINNIRISSPLKKKKKKSFFIMNVAPKTFERPGGGNPKLSESAFFNREKYFALLFPSRFFHYY